ncbi:ROK family transcriptional regulator [Rhizobium sp. BK251]|uniref:ROK family transcriptional regulator n=1 Tax=Rhizobium sp. BK251 TaxID=2512125 RepID=UPI0010473285|nr:ROK family transcriptional regulator [Rhizobium sp. BK251]TCL64095.1 putative NBD/HSP70 family sugar kinase [Rhizobium sp. BK251]
MTMPRTVRHINEVRALDVVFRHGRISRANIAKELNMVRSTASSIVASLTDEGLLVEDESEDDKSAGTGRPGTFVRINANYGMFIGADIGVGRMNVVALDMEASVIAQAKAELDLANADPDRVVQQLVRAVAEITENVGRNYRIRGLCLTAPGVIDRSGTILRAPILGWRQEPILERLQQRLPGIPQLVAENDANAFAIAEMYQSKEEGVDTEIYIYLDAGVGGAIVNSGQLLRGQDGYAGELGHIILGDEGFVELATISGSFESFIGREAVLARYRFHGGSAGDITAFIQAAKRQEQAALSTLKDWSFYLARGMATLTSIFNPARIVLGGPVAELFDLCRQETLQKVGRNLLDDHPIPEIKLSSLGPEGPAIGGASMLHKQMLSVDESLVYRRAKTEPAR